MTIPNKILVSGYQDEYSKGGMYEKITDDNELVAGRVAARGTAAHQFKIWETGEVAVGVFDKQISEPGQRADGKYDENYAKDTDSVDVLMGTGLVCNFCLNDGATITVGDLLMAETATGKLVAYAFGGVAIAVALESSSPSGADNDAFKARLLIDRQVDAAA